MLECWNVGCVLPKGGNNAAIAYADKNSVANIGALVYMVRTHTYRWTECASSLEMPSKGLRCFVLQIGTVIVVWYVFNRLLCDRFDLMDAYDPSPTAT